MVVVEEGCRSAEKGKNQQVAADEEGLAGKTALGMVVVPRGCSLMMVVAAGKVVDAAFGFEEAGLEDVEGNTALVEEKNG